MLKKLLYTILFISTITVDPQSVFIDKAGEVSFFSEAPLENIEAKHAGMNSILNTDKNELAFIVPIRGFKFEKELMQEHFNEKYMESDKFPNASYKCTLLDSVKWQTPGTYTVRSTGKFSMHGVEKEITEAGTFTIEGNKISLHSEFRIAIADYGIEIPKLLFQNIADTILVKLHSQFEPFKKK